MARPVLPPPEDRNRIQRKRISGYFFIPDETEAFGVFGRQEVQEVARVRTWTDTPCAFAPGLKDERIAERPNHSDL